MERNTHWQNQNAQNVGSVGFADACWRSSCRLAPTQPPSGRLPTLRSPMRFGDPILAFALSGRGLLGAIFHRALPCAMGFLPRWGGLVLP
ncbi:MAG: hypothetical protein LBQ66_16305, partial [Planctomycetaceae bacterium]|nr:hypothetical protein [Planctomycetaceae bacterium]